MSGQGCADQNRLAVVMTCHNRRDTTLSCLDALFGQKEVDDLGMVVYLVDDGSTDGTAEAVADRFSSVKVLKGDGSMYWCGGMRRALEEAMKRDYQYYLWLNDDTTLMPGALRTLLDTTLETTREEGRQGIVVGAARDAVTGRLTYGGLVSSNSRRPLDLAPVEPTDQPQRCDTMNGNCVLVPREVVRRLGNLSPEFTHGIGDVDYGLRAQAAHVPVWLAPGYAGVCSNNPGPRWLDPSVPLSQRLRFLHSPKGLPPREWAALLKRHRDSHWPVARLKLLFWAFFPSLRGRRGR